MKNLTKHYSPHRNLCGRLAFTDSMWILAIFAFTSLLGAQTAATGQPVQKRGRIEGRVYNAVTNEAVRKATVTLQPVGAQQQQQGQQQQPQQPGVDFGASRVASISDAEGKFIFENLAPGNYRVSGEKTGFVNNNTGGGFGGRGGGPGGFGGGGFGGGGAASDLIRIAEGSNVSDVRVKLVPQGVVSGRVADEDGEPFGGVRVTVMQESFIGGQMRVMPAGAAETNEVGDYRVANLPPGKYYLAMEKGAGGGPGRGAFRAARSRNQAAPVQQQEDEFAYARTYFPGVDEMGQAQRIEIAAGQELSGVGMVLRKKKVFRVSGELPGAAADGRYLVQLAKKGASQGLGMEMMMGGANMGRMREGKFEIPAVLPGAYTLKIMGIESRQPMLIARADVNVGEADVAGVVASAVSAATITGKMRLDETDAQAATLIKGLRVQLQSLEGGGFGGPGGGGGNAITAADDGAFASKELSPELFGVTVPNLASKGLYVKSITVNGQDVRSAGVDLRGGGSLPIDIVLSKKVATVSGTVEKASPDDVAGTVLLVREPYDPRRFGGARIERAQVATSGSFSTANLEPGRYRAIALKEVDNRLMYDPEWLKSVEDRSAVVEVKEGETKSVTLKQI